MALVPRNKDEVSFSTDSGGLIVTRISYPCGCEVDITWRDITKGEQESVEYSFFCGEHDPTTDSTGQVLSMSTQPWVEEGTPEPIFGWDIEDEASDAEDWEDEDDWEEEDGD